jgi:hypothetical protein
VPRALRSALTGRARPSRSCQPNRRDTHAADVDQRRVPGGGAAPDGDSVRFYPTADDAWRKAGLRVRANAAGGAQLRLEGIDALETHYTPSVGDLRKLHQPLEFGRAAAAELLRMLGFETIERGADEVVTAATPLTRPGYIMTRFADKYGRAVAFAFAGSTDEPDLGPVFLDPVGLAGSVNHQLLAAGLAYPTYYSKLFVDLRAALIWRAACQGAG